MEQMALHGKDSTRNRCARAMKSRTFDSIRAQKLIETTSEDFLAILNTSKVSANHYLRRLHNLALGLGWLPSPVLAPKLWPKPRFKEKRAITLKEHQLIIAAEKNHERKLFYELLWQIGASQSDAASLNAEQIDWTTGTVSYQRLKTGEWAQLRMGKDLEAIFKQLANQGPLFPTILKTSANDRSAEFYRRCKLLGIEGISLHSYRYAWAERAKASGYPERWAQSALGHNSRAIHQAYAKKAKVQCPSLEEYEKGTIPWPQTGGGGNP
jgi:integrase